MRKIFFALIVFGGHNNFAQETKLVIEKGKGYNLKRINLNTGATNSFTEEFYVLKSNSKIKHGTYLKYRPTFQGPQIIESGSYKNGVKDGLWVYFYDALSKKAFNNLKEKGNYVNGKKNGVWTYYYKDTIASATGKEIFGKNRKPDSVVISIDQPSPKLKMVGMYLNDKRVGEWTSFSFKNEPIQKFNFSKQKLMVDTSLKDSLEYNTNRKALFVGGVPLLIHFLNENFEMPEHLIFEVENDSLPIIVSFTINETGNVVNPQIQNHGNKKLEKEAIRLIELTDNNWIPAISDSKKISSLNKILFFVVIKTIPESRRKMFKFGFKPID